MRFPFIGILLLLLPACATSFEGICGVAPRAAHDHYFVAIVKCEQGKVVNDAR